MTRDGAFERLLDDVFQAAVHLQRADEEVTVDSLAERSGCTKRDALRVVEHMVEAGLVRSVKDGYVLTDNVGRAVL